MQDYESWLRYNDILDRPAAVRELILVEHLAQTARERGLDRQPAIRMEIGRLRHQIFWTKLREHVFSHVSVDDQEIKELRDQYPDAFQQPLKMRLGNIYLNSSDDAAEMAKIRARLESIRGELLAGADFETLARRESQSQTRFSGGKLGVMNPADLPAPAAEVVANLKEGEISKIVETGRGISIFLCKEIREPVVPSAEEVETKLRNNLLRLRGKQEWARTIQEMRDQIKLPDSLEPRDGFLELPGSRLSVDEVDALAAMQPKGRDGGQPPSEPPRALLENWCLGVLMEQRGLEMGFDRDPKVADNLRWKPAQVLAQHELAQRVPERVEPLTADEVEPFFRENPKKYRHLPEYRLAVIYFGTATNDGSAARQADAVSRKIGKGELTFAEAAKRFSRHPSAKDGGLLGWLPVNSLAPWGPKLVQAVRQMQPGERSNVFRLDSGIWLFELIDFRDARPMTFEEAKDQVEIDCLNHRYREAEEALRKEILDGLAIRIHENT